MFYTEPNWTYRFSQNQLDADSLYLSSPQIEPFCPENLPQMRKSRNCKVLSMKKNCTNFTMAPTHRNYPFKEDALQL